MVLLRHLTDIVDNFSAGSERGATMTYSKNEEQQSEYRGLAGLAGSEDQPGLAHWGMVVEAYWSGGRLRAGN